MRKIHKWTQGKKTDAELLAAIRHEEPNSPLLKTFEELDNGDGNLLGNFNLEVDDSLHLELVKGKRTGLEAVKFATNHAIDFYENLPSAFAGGGVPPHDDGLVV